MNKLDFKIIKRSYFFIIPLLLQSCSSMYIPSVRSIPLLEKKGEFQGEAGVSTNSIYVNGGYALTDKMAIAVNGQLSYRNFSDRYDLFTHINERPPSSGCGFSILCFEPADTRGKFAHRYGEFSMGRIDMLPKVKKFRMEVFGGIGAGRATDIDYFYNETRYKSDYCALFGQFNAGLKIKFLETGGSLRLVHSLFNYRVYSNTNDFLYEDIFGGFHLEPMIFARAGTENLKLALRCGFNLSFPIYLDKETSNYRGFDPVIGKWGYTPFHLSVGISYRIKSIKNEK